MKLKKYKLGDIAKIEISGVDKKTIEGETPVRLCNFVDVYYNWAITKEKAKSFMVASAKQTEIDKCSIGKGMVAITKDSETRDDIGVATYIADDFEDVLLGYHCALITPNPAVVDGKYLNAFMHTRYIQKYFENNASGSGQRYTLSNDTIGNIPVLIPSIEEQRTIGKVLADIDCKIELNKLINDNLEAMAKQLYDYWFVQFDFPNEEGKPYKSSGGTMVYNEKLKREIPQGWHCYELNKWLEIKSGFAFKSETYISKGKFKVVTIKNVQDHHLDTSSCDYVYEIPQGMKEWCSLSVNDRLISLTGNCGRLCIVTENDLLLNQRVGLLACNDEYIDYAYLLLSSEEYQTLSNNLAKGAAQANLSPVDLCKNIAVLPKLDVLEKFNRQIKPIVASYIQNEIQIAELTKQRDELLPLLMNGQATVNYHLSVFVSPYYIIYRDLYK